MDPRDGRTDGKRARSGGNLLQQKVEISPTLRLRRQPRSSQRRVLLPFPAAGGDAALGRV